MDRHFIEESGKEANAVVRFGMINMTPKFSKLVAEQNLRKAQAELGQEIVWRDSPPDKVGWWWHYPAKGSYHQKRVRPMRVIEHNGKLILEIHAGCVFDGYPGKWAGPITIPQPPKQ